jgi:hypothetical protein
MLVWGNLFVLQERVWESVLLQTDLHGRSVGLRSRFTSAAGQMAADDIHPKNVKVADESQENVPPRCHVFVDKELFASRTVANAALIAICPED